MSRAKHLARKEAQRKREVGGFVPMPSVVLRSEQFAALTPYAVKLLCDLLAQYKGDNNGDFCAAWSLMKPRGWRSKDTLSKALRELRHRGWVEVARQGGRHQASLYAVTFFAVDYCRGKLEIAATGSPSSEWRKQAAVATLPKLKSVPRQAYQSTQNCPATRVKQRSLAT